MSLLTAKVFDADGNGGSAAAIINAVAWCTDNGADIVNVSLGFAGGIPTTPDNQLFIRAFQAGLDYATSRGVLLIAAAGNEAAALPATGRIFLPAEAAGVTTAPNFTFPCANDGYFLLQGGTSQAAAHVAGTAAIIRGRLSTKLRSAALRGRIEGCLYRAVDNVGPDNIFGRGRVNAYKAATQSC